MQADRVDAPRDTEQALEQVTRRLRRRQRVLVGALVALVLLVVLGVAASRLVKSPAQVAAETSPPPKTVLTAAVERKVLSSSIVMRGSVTPGTTFSFTPSSVAASRNGPAGGDLVVTRLGVAAGRTVQNGTVVAEVSERPVFVLLGAFPAYRDLIPGLTGDDVRQLQHALGALGYDSWDKPGYFGRGTAVAVQRFYRSIGYAPALVDEAFSPPTATAAPAPRTGSAGHGPIASPRPTASSSSSSSSSSAPSGPFVMVPKSEVAFLPTLPANLSKVSGGVGSKVTTDFLTFTTGDVAVTGKLSPSDASLIRSGQPVAILDEVSGLQAEGVVGTVGQQVKPADGSDPYIAVSVNATKALPASVAGADVRITVTSVSTDGPVLAVPEAAISARADGRSFVTRVSTSGQTQVEVTPGVTADGLVEITVEGAGLAEGDQVVTGR